MTLQPGQVLRSVAWSFVESMTLLLLSLITLLVIARLLGPRDYGLAATVVVTVQLLNVAVEGLFSEALVQRQDLADAHISAALWTALGVAVAIVLLCWLGAAPAATLYHEPALIPLLRAGSIVLLFSAYSGVKTALIRRAMMFRLLAQRTLVARLAGCATGLILAFKGFGPFSVVAQSLVAAFLGAFALWLWSPIKVQKRAPHWPALRDLLRFTAPWLANEIVSVSAPRFFQIVSAYLFGAFQFGLFGMAFRLTDTLRDLLGFVASSVSMPIFARLQHDRPELSRQFVAVLANTTLVALPAFVGFVICSKTIVLAILGPAWLPCLPLIQALTVGAGASLLITLSSTTFSAIGTPGRALPLNLCNAILTLGALVVVAAGGISAAAILWSARQVVAAIVLLHMVRNGLQLDTRALVRSLLPAVGLAAAVSLILILVDNQLPQALPPGGRLGLLVVAGVLTMGVGIVLLRPELARLVVRQIRRDPAGSQAVGATD